MRTNSAQSAVPRLEARPEARAFVVDNLVRYLAEGALRIPRLEGGLKWDDDDRLKFLDSLYRGYPVGALLLWRRPAEAERVIWGARAIDAEARGDALWVVDGQQRLTTLAEAAFSSHALQHRPLCFDLEQELFRYLQEPGEHAGASLVPVAVLLDARTLTSWLRTAPAEHVDLALDASKRLREYAIPAYVIETRNEELVREIFERINRSGKALDSDAVFDALHGALVRKQPSSIDELAESLKSLGFGYIAPNTIYRAWCGIEGQPIDRADRVPEGFEAGPALAKANDSIRRVVAFLRNECAIPHASLLPYELPLVVLAKFFHHHAVPSQRSRILLRRWLWRGTLNERLTGTTVELGRHLQAVDPASESNSVRDLLALAGDQPKPYPRLTHDLHLHTARAKLACCALAGLKPRHLANGTLLDVAALIESHPDTLKEPLLSSGRSSHPVWKHLANRILHPRDGERLSGTIITCTDPAALHSHGIEPEAHAALQRGAREQFLTHRARMLDDWVERFSHRYAEWRADDSPSLDTLIIDDD